MIPIVQRGAWGALIVLTGAIMLDQTTELLNPSRQLDVSGLEEVDVSGIIPVSKSNSGATKIGESSAPLLDTAGLRKVGPRRTGGVTDSSGSGTLVIRSDRDFSSEEDDTLVSVPISHGLLFSDPSLRYLAPLSIRTATGANYFVKLIDARTTATVMTMYITGGRPMSVSAPLGTYRLRYASGSYWRGKRELFGNDTATAEADADFHFVETADGYSGYEVELIRQQSGNLSTTYISRDAF